MTTTVTTVTTEVYECHCLYDGDTLPEESWTAAGNPLYGSYCANWDSLPGTNGHKNDTECAPSDKCNKECNYINLPWCYVKDGCTGAVHSTSTCVAGPIVLEVHGTTTFVLVGLDAKRTPQKHVIVYLKVGLCRLRAQHIMGIPCMAPTVKKHGTKSRNIVLRHWKNTQLFRCRGKRVHGRVQLATRALVLCRERLRGFER